MKCSGAIPACLGERAGWRGPRGNGSSPNDGRSCGEGAGTLNKIELQVALALVPRAGRWLVAKRFPHVHLGNMWEFPGGKCEDGEAPEDAAVRELREECGVEAEALRTLDPVRAEYDDRVVWLLPVVCRWIAGEPKALECAECGWMTPKELQTLHMPTVNATVLREMAADARTHLDDAH